MSVETIYKLEPHRTMYLGGFSGLGAAAAMWGASATGFSVSGVFRDMADFATLYLWDADDTFSHQRWRFLPDFEFAAMVCTFDLAYTGLQPIDSAKYNWIDWATIDVIHVDGTRRKITLADYAVGTGAASASVTFTLGSTPALTQYSRVSLWYLNYLFEYWADGVVPSTADVLNAIAAGINGQTWGAGEVALTASVSGSGITITAAAGADGNYVTLYSTTNGTPLTGNITIAGIDAGKLSGGSAATSWAVTLDFSALHTAGVLASTQIRRLWMTFAPALQLSLFTATEWTAVFTSWAVSDPGSVRALQVAGTGSWRRGSRDFWVRYTGSGWAEEVGWYNLGFAHHTAHAGDSMVAIYYSQATHDLWLGTSLYTDRGIWSVSLDGDAATDLDMYLDDQPLITRRKLRSGVAAGVHQLTLTLEATKNAASSGYNAYFDYLDAAVAGDVPDAAQVYTTVGVATDYDTDATYKMPPQRLVWQIQRSGIVGDVDHYLGVYWWNQRQSVGAVYPTMTITIGAFTPGDAMVVEIGGTNVGKTVISTDTVDSIAAALVCSINEIFIGVWAEAGAPGSGVVTVACVSPGYTFTQSVVSGALTLSGDLGTAGTPATWVIDDTVTPVINRAVRDWHTDWFAELAAAGMSCTAAMSMELVNPPDAVGHVYSARYHDGTAVATATDFAGLFSTQCSFVAAVAAYQGAAYAWLATEMAAAGLTPWLQFGEFVWWFFAGGSPASMAFYDAETAAAFVAAEGRDLAVFAGPGSDPSVNAYVDANWLRARVKAHIDTIRGLALGAAGGTQFELLWPLDVNDPALGEGLNRYVNLPVEYEALAGSGLDRMKMEALSYGATLRNLDKALAAVTFPWTAPCGWARTDVKYLTPWFNGGCPWSAEFVSAVGQLVAGVDFWAWDHLGLLSWPLPLPRAGSRSGLVGAG